MTKAQELQKKLTLVYVMQQYVLHVISNLYL